MLLAIDVGNTNTVLGVFDGTKLVDHWRLATDTRRTADEYGLWIRQVLQWAGIRAEGIAALAVSSVVPPLQFSLEQMSKRYFGVAPLFVGPRVKTGRPILHNNP